MNLKKTAIALSAAAVLSLGLGACSSDADVASKNLSQAADNFEVTRRVVLHDDFTNTYTLAVVGKCSLGNDDAAGTTTVTCKTDTGQYLKHIFRTGDNVTVFAEQLTPQEVSDQHYKVYFKPEAIIPDIRVK